MAEQKGNANIAFLKDLSYIPKINLLTLFYYDIFDKKFNI